MYLSKTHGPYAWSCPNGLRLVITAKTSLSQFSGIHESEKQSPNALGRPTAKSANYWPNALGLVLPSGSSIDIMQMCVDLPITTDANV